MKKASAQAHAKHAHYCTCGRIVRGNGAKYQHRAAHKRNDDGGHHYVTREAWLALPSNQGLDKRERAERGE